MSGIAPHLRESIRELVRLAATQHMAHPADRERLAAVEELVTTALRTLGDDVETEYYAWFGRERYRVIVSRGPQGGLTGLRVQPEAVP